MDIKLPPLCKRLSFDIKHLLWPFEIFRYYHSEICLLIYWFQRCLTNEVGLSLLLMPMCKTVHLEVFKVSNHFCTFRFLPLDCSAKYHNRLLEHWTVLCRLNNIVQIYYKKNWFQYTALRDTIKNRKLPRYRIIDFNVKGSIRIKIFNPC